MGLRVVGSAEGGAGGALRAEADGEPALSGARTHRPCGGAEAGARRVDGVEVRRARAGGGGGEGRGRGPRCGAHEGSRGGVGRFQTAAATAPAAKERTRARRRWGAWTLIGDCPASRAAS